MSKPAEWIARWNRAISQDSDLSNFEKEHGLEDGTFIRLFASPSSVYILPQRFKEGTGNENYSCSGEKKLMVEQEGKVLWTIRGVDDGQALPWLGVVIFSVEGHELLIAYYTDGDTLFYRFISYHSAWGQSTLTGETLAELISVLSVSDPDDFFYEVTAAFNWFAKQSPPWEEEDLVGDVRVIRFS